MWNKSEQCPRERIPDRKNSKNEVSKFGARVEFPRNSKDSSVTENENERKKQRWW